MALSSVRAQSEPSRAPRVLHCEFPLGRPLGIPLDAPFQHRVLAAAFELLLAPSGPVFVEFGDVIVDEADQPQPLACPLPPAHDPTAGPAVNEVRGLRAAYERTVAGTGRSAVHRVLGSDGVAGAVATLTRVRDGDEDALADLPGPLGDVVLDIRAYFEEAGLALADHTPAARQLESWFYQHTETGRTLLAIRNARRDGGLPQAEWMFLAPLTQ